MSKLNEPSILADCEEAFKEWYNQTFGSHPAFKDKPITKENVEGALEVAFFAGAQFGVEWSTERLNKLPWESE